MRSVTEDGTLAVGLSGQGAGPNGTGTYPIRWTSSGGVELLPNPPADGTSEPLSSFVTASDITPDGSWIAYRARPGGTGVREAMICSGSGAQSLALGRAGPGLRSAANQISDDGSIVFGWGFGTDGNQHAFRWSSATGYQSLSEPSGYAASAPAGRGVSADGTISVGDIISYDGNSHEIAHQAYRWTAATDMQTIGVLPGGNYSAALAVSKDGSRVFGVSQSARVPGNNQLGFFQFDGELFLWTPAEGMTAVGGPPGYDTYGNLSGLSGDGAFAVVAAIDSTGNNNDDAFVYQIATRTFVRLGDLLAAGGAIDPGDSGWIRIAPSGISDNGNTIFGTGRNPNQSDEGWIARFPDGFLAASQAATYPDWQQQHFSAGQDGTSMSDPDLDGIPNAVEFASATNPWDASSGFRPSIKKAGSNSEFVYRRLHLPGNITYTVQQSTDLIHWSPVSPMNTILAEDSEFRLVQASAPTNASSRIFLRVHLTQ
ncbi:MAG TPA: hypothetical protein VJ719_14020 [Chthoniobacterales bacterium]|nr:hypothetical protein [Chthoniobacterales bacterium]